ncbi:MAG TPA: tetratricopeptide repeat protein, partial [Roseiflexaceae bacterium]|nr:tetratricopeptide repeat protein [Roseiflexaceae bacterium]
WERRGLAILIVGGLALAALVGLLAIAAAAWPLILQRALILITSVALVITIVLALLFHRADSAFGQRLSHGIAGRRWPIRVVGTIALLAMAAWASFGWDMSAREAHCTAPPRGYRHAKLYYPNIAVDASAMLNGEANVISFFLSQLTFAPVVSDQDWSDCQSFFEYRLRLSPIDRPGEHGYAATLYPNQSTASAEPVLLATGSQLRCGFLADLAVQIADHLQIPNSSDVEQWRSLAAPASCAVILKAQQGLEAIKAERYDDAERILLEVIEASERRWSVVYRYLGAVYLRTGRKQAATAALERAVALLPRPFTKAHTPFLITLAQAYYQQNKRPQAEQTLLTALTADPLHGYAHLNLAVYYREWGDYTRAAEHLQAARAWTPKGPGDQVAFVRSLDAAGGVLAFKLGRFDDAIELLEKAYRRHESLSELPYEHQGNGEAIVYYLAASYGETGQAARACSYWAIYDSIPLSNRTEELSRRQEAQQRRAGLACA